MPATSALVSRQEVLRVARTYLGSPWQHQGRIKGHGVDCVGLIIGVAYELGLFDCRLRNYQRDADGVTLERACAEYLDRLPLSDVVPADILMLNEGRYPCHLAIVGDKGEPCSIIHAAAIHRQVVEHRLGEPWLSQVVGAWRFRGVAAWAK